MNQIVILAVALSGISLQVNFAISQEANATAPLSHPAKVIHGEDQTCPTEEQLAVARNQFEDELDSLLNSILLAPSVQENTDSTPQPIQPEMSACGGPGWTRIIYLNMEFSSHDCPDGWMEYTTPIRVCGRPTGGSLSESVTNSTHGIEYQYVCGRARGYQFGATTAFSPSSSITIDTPDYVDGISITHGHSPRNHIWTFATGLMEGYMYTESHQVCPCANPTNTMHPPPQFVGNAYFCEAGTEDFDFDIPRVTFSSDPLWDGQGCGEATMCCSFNSPPWFTVQLPAPTTDDIEVRICSGNSPQYEDTRIELLEIYVH